LSKVEVEVYSLSDMNTALRRLDSRSREAVQQSQRAIAREKSRLQRVEQKRARNLSRCEAALRRCYSQVDEDGRRPSCTAQVQAVREAQAALQEVREQIARFDNQVSDYDRQASQFQQSMDGTIGRGRAYLEKHIDTALWYLRNHPSEISRPDAGTHGSLYQRARRERALRDAHGELSSNAPHLEGHFNQIRSNPSGYLPSPEGYHASHRVAGIDIPENLTWLPGEVNQQRFWDAWRRGEPPTYY
jgi:chromosome segregation ATPase